MSNSNVEMPPTHQASCDLDVMNLQPIEGIIEVNKIELVDNSNDQETTNDDNILIESKVVIDDDSTESKQLEEQQSDEDYFSQFIHPDDIDDDLKYFDDDNNDENFMYHHMNRKQFNLVEDLEVKLYERSKRINKKMFARSQIKDKHANSIKIHSRNKQIYIHHRLAKILVLDPPTRRHKEPSKEVETIVIENRSSTPQTSSSRKNQIQNQQTSTLSVPPPLLEYTINEHTLQNNASFDDAMIAFLFDMQNRDLSPEDYEMLLRLDERVQCKTVDASILEKLPTTNADETHLNEICTICMDAYTLGQEIKTLPCSHMFHLHCIETYLKDFSVQCPLDNLPLV